MAAAENGGQIHVSSDFGQTWAATFQSLPVTALSMTRDGRQLVVAVPISGKVTTDAGLYYSGDFGQTWQALATPRTWRAAALSGDGNALVAAARGEGVDPMAIAPGLPGGHIFVTRASAVTAIAADASH